MRCVRGLSGTAVSRVALAPKTPSIASFPSSHRPRRKRTAVHRRPRLSPVAATTAAQSTLPDGLPAARSQWRHYETLVCLSASITEEQKDHQLARLESFLLNKNAEDVVVTVKGPYKLAYPIKRNEQGTYALFTYTAKRHVSKDVEYLLSHPDVGTEEFILRYKTFAVKN